MYNNGDGDFAFILVESMERSGWSRTNRPYVCIPVLWFGYCGSIQCKVLTSSLFPVNIYYNGYDRRAPIILVQSMQRYRWLFWFNLCNDIVGPGRTARTFACLCCVRRWSCHSGSVQYAATISLPFVSQYTTMAMLGVRLFWLNWWNDPVGPGRTASTLIFLCITCKVSFGFDAVWGHNLTSIMCLNIRKWR